MKFYIKKIMLRKNVAVNFSNQNDKNLKDLNLLQQQRARRRELKMNQSSQSSSTLRDITTGALNRLIVRGSTEEGKLRSKSMNGNSNGKRMLGQYNDNTDQRSVSKLTRFYQIPDETDNTIFSKHHPQRISSTIQPHTDIKLTRQQSKSYSQLYHKSSLVHYQTIKQYSLWMFTKNNHSINPFCVDNNVVTVAENQHSWMLLNNDYSFKAFSKDSFMKENNALTNAVNKFFKLCSVNLQEIHCTPFANFFIDSNNTLYAMGLNDRGQLGITGDKIISIPTKVPLPFSTSNFKSGCNSSKTKSISPQRISKITGGPFHTVILTTSKKSYYSGILYQQDQLQNDQYISIFREIKTKDQTSLIKDIACGLASIVLLTQNNRLLLMGIFGDNIYSSPTQLQFPFRSRIKQFASFDDCIFIITQSGLLYKADMKKKIPIIIDVNLTEITKKHINKNDLMTTKIIVDNLYLSNNMLIVSTKQTSVGPNGIVSFQYFILQTTDQNQNLITKQNQWQEFSLPLFKQIQPQRMFITKNHVYCLIDAQLSSKIQHEQKSMSEKIIINQNEIQAYMTKIKQLQEQNVRLRKENILLNKQKKQKTPKKEQKLSLSNINYNFQKEVTPRTFTNDLQIDFSEIKLTKKIAQGGYGVIYKGEWKKTQVAVKIFKIDQNNTNSVKQFISQCRAMQALRHPNIVMFLGACLKSPNFAIILQYCQGGTLWSLLQNHKIDLPWKQRINLALQTARAMNYLHDRKLPIVHRDLKSLNVLLDVNRKVKLADFGWTKSLESYMTSKIGTYQWMAPQVLMGQKYSQKADVFSFSIILWQIASRQPPYRNINGIQVAYDVANKQYRPSIPSGTPNYFQRLITQCWEKDPEKRPSFKDIIDTLEKHVKTIN